MLTPLKKRGLTAVLLAGWLILPGQDFAAAQEAPVRPAPLQRIEVSEPNGQIMSYREGIGSTRVRLQGTRIAPRTTLDARVESKRGVSEIEIRRGGIKRLERARRYGQDFLTYVVWAVSVDGQASNLGEITFDDRRPRGLTVTTNLQTFWLLVTAEPNYSVLDPSPVVVAYSYRESAADEDSLPIGGTLFYFTHYTEYSNAPSTAPIDVPNDLLQARKAVELAEKSGILAEPAPAGGTRTTEEKRVHDTLSKAREFLSQAENVYVQDKSNNDVMQFSRTAVQISENARALALGAVGGIFITKLEAELAGLRAEAEDLHKEVARLNVENEPMRRAADELRHENQEVSNRLAAAQRELAGLRTQIEQLEAEVAREHNAAQEASTRAAESEGRGQSAEAGAEALRAEKEAEINALRSEQEARMETFQAELASLGSELEAARAEHEAQTGTLQTEIASLLSALETARAEYAALGQDRDAICGELRRQLSSLGELNDQGGGMVLTLASDILFGSGSYELHPVARENLAKLAVLRLLLFPNAEVRYEGHTDRQGEEDYNQWLSEQRALAVYRYILEQGLSMESDPAGSDRLEARLARSEKLLAMSFGAARRGETRRLELLAGLDGAVVGKGEREPLIETESAEEKNRRVMLRFPPSPTGGFSTACGAPAD